VVQVVDHGESATEVTNYTAVIKNGNVKQFPRIPGPRVAW
jgi:hypothetical protein